MCVFLRPMTCCQCSLRPVPMCVRTAMRMEQDENDRLLTLLAAGGNVGECARSQPVLAYRQEKTALALMVAASAGEDQLAKYSQLISEPLLDWAIENIRLRQFDLLQLRAAEVCVGCSHWSCPLWCSARSPLRRLRRASVWFHFTSCGRLLQW
jgi:hypothetical protein